MPKFTVTPNMGAALRNLRQSRNFKAIDVAKSIGKTGAYISKLEKGVLNTIDKEDFLNIIKALSSNQNEFDSAIDLLLKDATLEYSEDEAKEEEWKMNIDLFFRRIPVPKEYISIVKDKMKALNINIPELVKYINTNSELYDSDELDNDMLNSAPKNQWIFNNGHSFIVMEVTEKNIQEILDEEVSSSNYSLLQCILLSLFKLENLPIGEAYKETSKILLQLKIQTLNEKMKIMEAYQHKKITDSMLKQKDNPELSESDRQLINSLYQFTNEIRQFGQTFDIEYTNNRMSTMLKNMTNDPILFMGYMGIDLSKLKKCDIEIKRDFVNAVRNLVDEYSVKEPPKKKPELI